MFLEATFDFNDERKEVYKYLNYAKYNIIIWDIISGHLYISNMEEGKDANETRK